ncbi:unnamed protein product [Ceratitis capitata]|uniref:(Mediterranean fruit fly) hypothetical protein n=1 Tax=Ceratitis capitata TaxID=7213 RepID=A0A811U0U3_CERCA|nr:unnamed protein product [Ceratitis capitata]
MNGSFSKKQHLQNHSRIYLNTQKIGLVVREKYNDTNTNFLNTRKEIYKKVQLPYRIIEASFSSMHTVLLVEKGLIYTMGRNIEGQLGAGHTNCVEQPILVDFIKHRTIVNCQCNDQGTIVTSQDNVITFWGTRNGIPEFGDCNFDEGCNQNINSEVGNSTVAFTNFLASVYKSELLLEPVDLLALYASKEQGQKGYYITVNNVYLLAHSVLVLVDTTTPLVSSLEELQ